ncbi:hypothetical protein D3C87_1478910 [compost metagenome]
MCLHAEIGEQALVTHDIHRRQEHDGDIVETAIRPDPLDHIQPVHNRHVIIENDGVDGKTEGCSLLQHGNARWPVLHSMAVDSPSLQLLRQYAAIDVVIVDDEYAYILDRHGKKRSVAPFFRNLKRNIDLEGRSLADFAHHIDRTVEKTDKTDRDRQSQSRSLVPPRR